MTTGQTIRALRKKRGLTQKELGSLCGLRDTAVSAYEREKSLPKKRAMEALAKALDVPVSVLSGEPAFQPQEEPPLFKGMLQLLSGNYGPVEEKTLASSGGGRCRYYTIASPAGGFVLHESGVAAMARAAQASLLPLLEHFRARQAEPLKKLG